MEATGLRPLNPEQERLAMIKAFGDALEFDHPLAPHTSMGTGGPARFFIVVTSIKQLTDCLRKITRIGLPFFLMGGGSNLLVSDLGFDGLVIKLDIRGLEMVDETTIECGAGEDLMTLVNYATEHSLTGLEFAAGIWGTVGGAVYGNAGAYGGEIGQILTEIYLLDQKGTLRAVEPEYCRFDYRDSYLKLTNEIVVKVKVSLTRGDQARISEKVEEIIAIRKAKHPEDGHSAGSFFKNIPDSSQEYGKLAVGKLLEQAGVKGMSVGGAKVFEKHANMIVNTGTATSEEISELATLMKRKVKEKFGIELEEEVIRVGHFEKEGELPID